MVVEFFWSYVLVGVFLFCLITSEARAEPVNNPPIRQVPDCPLYGCDNCFVDAGAAQIDIHAYWFPESHRRWPQNLWENRMVKAMPEMPKKFGDTAAPQLAIACDTFTIHAERQHCFGPRDVRLNAVYGKGDFISLLVAASATIAISAHHLNS